VSPLLSLLLNLKNQLMRLQWHSRLGLVLLPQALLLGRALNEISSFFLFPLLCHLMGSTGR